MARTKKPAVDTAPDIDARLWALEQAAVTKVRPGVVDGALACGACGKKLVDVFASGCGHDDEDAAAMCPHSAD